MTIAATSIRMDYTGAGTTGPFTFPFCIFDITKLKVIQTDLSGNDTTLALTTGFTVVGIKAPTDYTEGGTLTLVNAITSGYHLAIISAEDGTQSTSIKNNSDYYAYLHENEFDKLSIMDLQQQEQINKSIKAPDSEPAGTANLTLPHVSQRANTYLTFDGNGDVSTENAVVASGGVPYTGATQTVDLNNKVLQNVYTLAVGQITCQATFLNQLGFLSGGSNVFSQPGAPNNSFGSNGDYWIRQDGVHGTSTCIYHKEGGTWYGLI